MTQRKDLCGIRERHGPFAGTVEGGEHEDEQRDDAQVRAAGLGNVEGEAGRQERPGHLREGEE